MKAIGATAPIAFTSPTAAPRYRLAELELDRAFSLAAGDVRSDCLPLPVYQASTAEARRKYPATSEWTAPQLD